LNDAARAARALAARRRPSRKLLSLTEAGHDLVEIGFGDDLEICAELDRHDIVAEMRDQAIVRAGG
ncbi:MAG TPA: 2-phosphosulfolactate phosphatase, partial [Longimicrobiales bacterium]|nr:2-phosphosulfolactate phosphatase [Longimicrobiales bacterium]